MDPRIRIRIRIHTKNVMDLQHCKKPLKKTWGFNKESNIVPGGGEGEGGEGVEPGHHLLQVQAHLSTLKYPSKFCHGTDREAPSIVVF